MRKIVAEKIVDEVANWGHSGLIDKDQSVVLTARYSSNITLGGVLLRWLGFIAVFLLGMSVLGFVGMNLGKAAIYASPFIIGILSYIMWRVGVKLASDPQQRYPTSGAVLVTAGLIGGMAALFGLYAAFGGRNMQHAPAAIMLVIAIVAFFTAYRYSLRWPLVLAVLLLFHALGNMHSYGGSGRYYLGVRGEGLTFIVALITMMFGLWHEYTQEKEEGNLVGFGKIYIIIGLLYTNLSLWILSIRDADLLFVILFSAFCVAQLIAGARLHDGRFIGFGIVFLSINMYTRLFEGFWHVIPKGNFFLLSGLIALVIGVALEFRSKNLKAEKST